MNRSLLLTMLVFAYLTAPVSATPRPDDFAFGRELILAEGEAIYEFDLPEEAYRTMGAQGESLAVFNADGELVPFRVFPPVAEAEALPPREILPFFPIPAAEQGDESLSVVVQRGDNGEILSLRQNLAVQAAASIYLLDLSTLRRPVAMLELGWADEPAGVVGKVRVEESEDLKQWRVLAEGLPVAKLQFGTHHLERQSVELRGQSRPYLRLTFQGVPATFRLEEVRAVAHLSPIDPARQRLALTCRKLEPNEFAFSLPGAFPVDRIRVKPPQPNTVALVTFYSRAAQSDPWSRRATALIYDLSVGGTSLTHPEVRIGALNHRYWLMRVDAEGGGMGEGLPDVEIGWIAHRLRFVARGAAPFILAYGSARPELARLQADGALLRLGSAEKELPLGRADLGPEIVLGGAQAMIAGDSPRDWKSAFLWSALVTGVSLLGWMALALYRRMGHDPPE